MNELECSSICIHGSYLNLLSRLHFVIVEFSDPFLVVLQFGRHCCSKSKCRSCQNKLLFLRRNLRKMSITEIYCATALELTQLFEIIVAFQTASKNINFKLISNCTATIFRFTFLLLNAETAYGTRKMQEESSPED